MTEQIQETLNEEIDSSPIDDAPGFNPDSDGLRDIDDGPTDDSTPAEEQQITEEEPEKTPPFHEHPDWQRMMKARDEAVQRNKALEERLAALEQAKPEEKAEPDYKDLSAMEAEDIHDWIERDPVGYSANLVRQAYAEIMAKVNENQNQMQQTDNAKKALEDFGEKNEGFREMLESGEIQNFINSNPYNNAFSAYHQIRAANLETETQKKIEEAVKAKEVEMTKNFKAKQKTRVLGQGPSASASKVDPELNDVGKKGLIATLAARHARRRQAV